MTGTVRRWTTLALLGLLVGAATASAHQSPARADIVVDYGSGSVAVRQVAFDGPFTGLDLLTSSGLDLEMAGSAVCSIDGVGCPGSDCFCACATAESCRFWHYHHAATAGGWEMAATGPAEAVLADGAVDGWVWSDAREPITATVTTRAALRGMAWLAAQRSGNGSIADHAGLTAELLIAARAAGMPLMELWPWGVSPVQFLEYTARAYSNESTAAAGKLSAAIVAAGYSPRRFGGLDVIAVIQEGYDPATGRYGSSVWDQSWAILGLAAAKEPIPPAAASALSVMEPPDGGWGAAPGSEPDPDSTGLALQALAAAGRSANDPAMQSGVGYLRRAQAPDGGWGHGAAGANANSTAYAVQGLIAAGEDPAGAAWSGDEGRTPMDQLLAMQLPEGRFEFANSPADLVATLQVVPAVAGRTQGEVGTRVAADRAVAWVLAHRTAEGGYEGFQPGATLDAVLALAATGIDPNLVAPSGRRPSDYLRSIAAEYSAGGAAAAGKLAMGVVALGSDPREFGGTDVVAALDAAYDANSGAYGTGTVWDNALAILGLSAASVPVPQQAVEYLMSAASPAGGWGFEARAEVPDVDSTALALQALASARLRAAQPETPAVRMGVEALARLQLPNGAFAGYGGLASVNSTAAAVSGLIAFQQAPDGAGWRRDVGLTRRGPIDSLLAAQGAGGAFPGFSGLEDPSATYAALFALSGESLPLASSAALVFLPLLINQ